MLKRGDNLSFVKVRAKKNSSSNLINTKLIREYFDILSSFKMQDSVEVNSIKDAFNCSASICIYVMHHSYVLES